MAASNQHSLEGKCALVTGASRRIGAAIVRRLHADGAAVGIHYRHSATEARALAAELNQVRQHSAEIFQADLGDTASIDKLIDAYRGWRDRLDILVNNASGFYPTPVGQITEEAYADLLGSNLKGPLFLMQGTAGLLRAAKGNIINLIDIHARRPLRDHGVYGAAKAGLAMLTRSMAKDLAPDVRVNGVAPGAILWPEDGLSDEARASILRQIPLQRPGTPADIADCVAYLLAAPYVTGQIIAVDGGRSIGW
jgi:pteridine reductase